MSHRIPETRIPYNFLSETTVGQFLKCYPWMKDRKDELVQIRKDFRLFGTVVHKIGLCGAMSYETQDGPVCCECYEFWSTMKRETDRLGGK